MNTLDRYILQNVAITLIFALAFFVLIIEMIDLFSNLTRYQDEEITTSQILYIQWLFLPKSISYSLPIASLFAASYVLANLSANNEMIIIFSSRRSLYRTIMPIVAFGILLSFFSFFFEEYVVIPTFREKNRVSDLLLVRDRNFNANNVAVRGNQGRHVYYADYYNDIDRELSDVIIVVLDEEGYMERRLDVEQATWNTETSSWDLKGIIQYSFVSYDNIETERIQEIESSEFNIKPESFQKKNKDIDELTIAEAEVWIEVLMDAGAEYQRQSAEYLSRYSFALTPLVVFLLASSLTGRFRKNAILMSLLISLFLAVAYFVAESTAIILAADGIFSPIVAAWIPVFLFLAVGILLFFYAPT